MSEATHMTADPKRTKMVAPAKEKAYKIEILRDCEVTLAEGGEKKIVKAGEVVEVTASCAKDLLTTKYDGMYTHVGETDGGSLEKIVRARPYKGERKAKTWTGTEVDLEALYENS